MSRKICFVSTYIGKIENKEISNNFEKNEECDYLFFTNLTKEDFGESCWEIITVDLNEFSELNNVKISRYFKFMSFKYIREKLGRDYDYIFYCDCYLYPESKIDWIDLSNEMESAELEIMQYIHPSKGCIKEEMDAILLRSKETKQNIKNTIKYLGQINKRINLSENGLLFENTVIGFCIKSEKVTTFLSEYWKYYKDCPTYRDQPLWNFMIKNSGKKICVKKGNNFRNFFLGKKSFERRLNHY